MESLATTLSEAFHSFKRQNLGEDKVINEDRGNDSVDEELHRGKGECEPQKTCQGKGQSCKRKFDVADEGSDSSDEEGKTSFGFKKSCARTGTSTVTKGDTGSDPDRNEDSLGLGGHDSLDEDINKLIDPPDKEAEGKEGDILDEISVQHVAAEKLGKSINNKVAGIVNSLFANKQKEDKINKIIEEQARPENCPNLFVKTCNEEIWRSIMSIDDRKKDKQFQKVLSCVMSATLANVEVANLLVDFHEKNEIRQSYKTLQKKAIDSVALLAHACAELNQIRRCNIKPRLPSETQVIAHTAPLDSKDLFGPDVTKQLQNIKTTTKVLGSKHYRGKQNFNARGYNSRGYSKNWNGAPRNQSWGQRGAPRGRARPRQNMQKY